jgi:WD40 repeat protein
LEKGDAVTAILLCLEALPDDDAPVKRPFVASAARVCFNALYHLREERVFALPDEWTWDLAVSDDGRRLMTHATSGARVLDMASGKEVANLEDKVVIVSTDAALAVTQHGKHVRVWSLSSAGEVPNLQRSFDLSPAKELGTLVPEIFNAWMVYGGRSCAFEVVRSKPGHAPLPLRSALPIKEEYECASFSSNGERIVTTPLFDFSFPTTVSTWNARTGRKLADLKGHKAYVRTAEFSADGARVATGAADRTARVWDAESGKQLVVLKGHEDDVTCARFSPDGSLLVTASYDGSFRVWNLSQRSVTALLRGHVGKMPKTTDIFKEFWPRARFTPDGRQVMTIWKDRTARLWNLEPGKILQQVLTGHGRKVNSVSFHPDGKKFATVSDDKTVLLWDAKTKMQISTWARLKRAVRDIAFSPDGTMLAAAVGNELVLWSTESQQEISRIATSQDICKIAFSPEGSRVVMTFLEEAGVWNLSSRKRISTFNEGGYDARFSPSGLIVASCGDERAIRLWNAETGREIGNAIFQGHSLLCIAFDREGQRVLVGSDDHTARIWKIMTEPSPETVITLSGHDQGVNSAEFNAAGTLVVTASQDNTVRLWDSATGEMLAVFEGHSDNVLRATFSPSGDQIVSVSADRSVRIWQLFPTTQALIDYAKKVVARVLTPDQRKQFFLDPDPPAWYGKLKKWPYS